MKTQTIEFLFPIDPNWTEEEVFSHFYAKIKKYPDLYLRESVLNQFKRVKKKTLQYLIIRFNTFFKLTTIKNEPLPIIHMLVQIVDQAYSTIRERNLKNNEILIIRFLSTKNPPESSNDMVWYTYIQQKISLPQFLE